MSARRAGGSRGAQQRHDLGEERQLFAFGAGIG
jgi:hypothetical protein